MDCILILNLKGSIMSGKRFSFLHQKKELREGKTTYLYVHNY